MTIQGAAQARIMNTVTDPFGWWEYQTFACKNLPNPALSWLTNHANKAAHETQKFTHSPNMYNKQAFFDKKGGTAPHDKPS